MVVIMMDQHINDIRQLCLKWLHEVCIKHSMGHTYVTRNKKDFRIGCGQPGINYNCIQFHQYYWTYVHIRTCDGKAMILGTSIMYLLLIFYAIGCYKCNI